MSSTVPAALKAADIARFALRAGQLETARPAVAYWCNYWMVEQIIAKGLHQADDESKAYTMRLMDKLEQTKIDFADNNAITDDMAGQAFIEQFGQETFQRAENAMKANKVTRQTADTFQAAATFQELCQIWGPLDADALSKVKYAKYHALRIAKAIKAGEDPNDSNPRIEAAANGEPGPPASADFTSNSMLQENVGSTRQPSVEDVSDQTPADLSMSNPSESHGSVEHYYQAPPPADVSPLAPSDQGDKHADGYFAGANNKIVSNDVSPVESVPYATAPKANIPQNPQPEVRPVESVQQWPMSGNAAPAVSPDIVPPISSRKSTATEAENISTKIPQAPPAFVPSIPVNSQNSRPTTTNYRDDEVSVIAAQKHARFAISALNFEDVPTAVKQLREALASLGANP